MIGGSREENEDTIGNEARAAAGLLVKLGRPRTDGQCQTGSVPDTLTEGSAWS